MGVIFDEVSATVETPQAAASMEQNGPEEAERKPEPLEQFQLMMETYKRRMKRLCAD